MFLRPGPLNDSRDLTLLPGQALVRVKCVGINEDDVALRKRNVPISQLGSEFSGVIVCFDKSAKSPPNFNFKIDQEVFGYVQEGGAIARFVVCDMRLLMPKPKELSFEQAAAIPDMWINALQLLKNEAEFKKRERIAVFNALSPRGQALVQLAQILGCRRVHCIVSNAGSVGTVRKHLKFHTALCDEVIPLIESDQVLGQIASFDPKGLESVIDLRPSPAVVPEMMRPQGRIVITAPPRKLSINWELIILKGIKIKGISLRSRDPRSYEPHCEFIVEHLVPKLLNKTLSLPIARKYDSKSIKQALKFVETNPESIGKVVVCIGDL